MGSYSKQEQLSRGPKRPARVKANREEWAVLRATKLGPCRLYSPGETWMDCAGKIELHHAVPRAQLGDDVQDNLIPLCNHHHSLVSSRNHLILAQLAENLTDAEYTYCIEKLGEGALERLFGVMARPEPRFECTVDESAGVAGTEHGA